MVSVVVLLVLRFFDVMIRVNFCVIFCVILVLVLFRLWFVGGVGVGNVVCRFLLVFCLFFVVVKFIFVKNN